MADLKPYYVIHGSDRPKIRQAVGRLHQRFDAEVIEQFDAGATPAADVIDAATMMGLLADTKLIIVQGAEEWKADDVSEMVAYLAAPSDTAVVAMIAEGLRSNSRLLKAANAGPGDVLGFDGPDKHDMPAWVRRAFEQRQVTVDTTTARRLVDRLGGNPSVTRLDAEIERLVAWAGGENLTSSDIDELVELDVEMSVFSLVDAWINRDRTTLLQRADRLLWHDREEPMKLVAILAGQIRGIHAARRLLDEMPAGQVVEELKRNHGMKPYSAKKNVEHAQRITDTAAAAGLTRIALLESELRGAAALSSRRESVSVVFERGLAELVV